MNYPKTIKQLGALIQKLAGSTIDEDTKKKIENLNSKQLKAVVFWFVACQMAEEEHESMDMKDLASVILNGRGKLDAAEVDSWLGLFFSEIEESAEAEVKLVGMLEDRIKVHFGLAQAVEDGDDE